MKDISLNLYGSETASATLGLAPNNVRGIDATLQHWLRAVMTRPGSNVFDREYGSSIAALVGANIDPRGPISEVVSVGLQQATASVIRGQDERDIPDDERLVRHELLRVDQSDRDKLRIIVRLYNANNQVITVGLSV